MENASKALIMAATVLLGVMIISIGVALFNSFSEFGRDALEKAEEKKIAEWNNNFFKYYGNVMTEEDTEPKPIKVTAHDIVTLANLAKQNNEDYELTVVNSGDETTYYIQVIVKNESNNFETFSDNQKNQFLKSNSLKETINADGTVIETETKYFKCSEPPTISTITKRVMSIKFEPY